MKRKSRIPISLPFLGQLAAISAIASALSVPAPAQPNLRFRAEEIESNFGVGYAVLVADINGDATPDVVAINERTVSWWENPTWERHIILAGGTIRDNVCIAENDIDGDGKLDIALGASWPSRDALSGGTLHWIGRQADPKLPWAMHPITAEPTLHRMRWGDFDGDGKLELLIAPLHGRGAKRPNWWEGPGAQLLILYPPADVPAGGEWKRELASGDLHVVHNFVVTNFDADSADEFITASYEGVYLHDRATDGRWTSVKLGDGHQEGDADRGAGEVKIGRLRNGKRYIATIEPWHAHQAVIYEEPPDPKSPWTRRVIASQLGGGHALWTTDLDNDNDDELIVGWRDEGKGEFAKPGLAVFDPGDWKFQIIDSGGMATEDATAADLNGDGRPEIVAAGRGTHNLKIYWATN